MVVVVVVVGVVVVDVAVDVVVVDVFEAPNSSSSVNMLFSFILSTHQSNYTLL